MLSISWFVHMCVCLSVCVCVCVCVFTCEVPFKRLFAPTSQSWMSKKFRDSESLGKSNVKKWSQIWKLLLIKGVRLPFVFGQNLQGSGGYTTRIRRLYFKDQEVIQQGSGGYTTRIRRLFFQAIMEPLKKTFFWYRCYYSHWLRDALSPVCRISDEHKYSNIQIFE